MKAISDKKFDDIFKSSFEDFEVEPSAGGWDKISAELEAKPKGKKFPIFWSAAASIIVVLGIGIGLYSKPGNVIKLRPTDNNEVVASNLVNEKPDLSTFDPKYISDNEPSYKGNSFIPVDNSEELRRLNEESKKNKIIDATKRVNSNVFNTNRAEQIAKEQGVAIVKPERIKTVTEQILAEEALQRERMQSISSASVLASNTDDNLKDDSATDRKLKIKSVGDIVNFVVAKVDRRDEKIIKVSRTDESDNEITEINLGLFKFKKSNK